MKVSCIKLIKLINQLDLLINELDLSTSFINQLYQPALSTSLTMNRTPSHRNISHHIQHSPSEACANSGMFPVPQKAVQLSMSSFTESLFSRLLQKS